MSSISTHVYIQQLWQQAKVEAWRWTLKLWKWANFTLKPGVKLRTELNKYTETAAGSASSRNIQIVQAEI